MTKPLTLMGRSELLAEIERLRALVAAADAYSNRDMYKPEPTPILVPIPDCGALVIAEFKRSGSIHAPMNSAHEGYAVLLEEVDELWAEVKKGGDEPRSLELMRKEAIQVGAMALRFLHDVCGVTAGDEAAS